MRVQEDQEIAIGDMVEFEGKEYKFDSVGTSGINIRDIESGELKTVAPMQLKQVSSRGAGEIDTRTEEQILFDDIKQKQREEQDVVRKGAEEADKIARDLDEQRVTLREEALAKDPSVRLNKEGERKVKEAELNKPAILESKKERQERERQERQL